LLLAIQKEAEMSLILAKQQGLQPSVLFGTLSSITIEHRISFLF